MSKSYPVTERKQEKFHVHSSHGAVNTKITTKDIPKYCSVLPLFKMSLGTPMHKTLSGGLKAENT
jgi:hypothetical protein